MLLEAIVGQVGEQLNGNMQALSSCAAPRLSRDAGVPDEAVVQAWTAPLPPHLLLGRLLDRAHPVLLDSAGDQGGQGRWSFLACDPVEVVEAPAWRPGQPAPDRNCDPFTGLRQRLRLRPIQPDVNLPFCGGAIGCWGYDLRYRLERLPVLATDEATLPDAWIGIYDALYAYDHASGQGFLVQSSTCPGATDASERLRRLRWFLSEGGAVAPPLCPRPAQVETTFTREGYVAAVRRVKEYVAAGDIYQANLAQRFTATRSSSPYELYVRLRAESPAPFAAYVDGGTFQVLSSSPERFLRVRDGLAETRPIKGTRPRGSTPADDARLANDLLGSEKDRAELTMIVDLERNDLGKVCDYGSVRVERLLELESHPTVHHLVATVTGRLRRGVGALDALQACFPGGSITGAPKIRAMSIIEEIEPVHRGFYTGAIGYVGFDGRADWNVAIRTLTVTRRQVALSAGAGIVADSDPELEYEEMLHKSRAMLRAIGAAP
jgi:para-aminobenzoate synthetase component 1